MKIIEKINMYLTMKPIKYNHYIRPMYYNFITWALAIIHIQYLTKIILFMNIIPCFILITLLVLDIFWFHKLEMFLIFISIGIFPLIFKYYKYCFCDIKEHYLEELEKKYDVVQIFEKGFEFDIGMKMREYPEFHNQWVSVRKYFDIKYNNYIEWLYDETGEQFQYVGTVYCRDDVCKEYRMKKYNFKEQKLTTEDYAFLEKQFEETIPLLIDIQFYIDNIEIAEEESFIKYSKTFIMFIYFICWSYFLIVSTLTTENLKLTILELLSKHNYEMLDLFGGSI